MIGLYFPGDSPVHRLRAGWKLLLLAIGVFATVLIDEPWQLGPAVLVVVALYTVARIPARTAALQLKPLIWVLPFIAVFQLIFGSWQLAVLGVGVLTVNVALAGLLTLTTTVTAILNLCQSGLRPLRRFGVDPDRVGLLLALTIRCVPLVAGIVSDVVLARKARGVSGFRNSAIALAAPAVVRALRTADALGDALRARGVDD